jgi:hypothetical protein
MMARSSDITAAQQQLVVFRRDSPDKITARERLRQNDKTHTTGTGKSRKDRQYNNTIQQKKNEKTTPHRTRKHKIAKIQNKKDVTTQHSTRKNKPRQIRQHHTTQHKTAQHSSTQHNYNTAQHSTTQKQNIRQDN